jgi:hypothetical protein
MSWDVTLGESIGSSSATRWTASTIIAGGAQTPLQDHTASGSDWAHLAVNTLIWVVLPLAFGAWRLMRSEVTSA